MDKIAIEHAWVDAASNMKIGHGYIEAETVLSLARENFRRSKDASPYMREYFEAKCDAYLSAFGA